MMTSLQKWLIAMAVVLSGSTQAADNLSQYNIAAQSLATALIEYSRQSDTTIFAKDDLVAGKQAPAVQGNLTSREALEQLLSGSGLIYRGTLDEGITISAAGGSEKPQAVKANEAGESAADNTAAKYINEVIVTATKRESSLQDTPMSITALGSEEINRRGLIEMSDYLRTIPGVSQIELGVGQSAIVMRGVSADPQSEGYLLGTPVGAYFGEIPLSSVRPSPTDIKLIDLERVEVLRGPQGTLYGAGSLTGTVRNIPVAPNLQKLEGRVKAGISNTGGEGSDNNRVEGVVNIPLVEDSLAIRAVAYRFDNSGYYKNVAASNPDFSTILGNFGASDLLKDENDVGKSEYTGGRIATLWKPNDKFSATFTYLKQTLEQEGRPESLAGIGEFSQTRIQFGGLNGEKGERLGDESEITNLTMDYDFGWGVLLSSSTWSDTSFLLRYDLSSFFGNAPLVIFGDTDIESYSQEVRLASNLDGRIQFLTGFYYEDVEFSDVQSMHYIGDVATLNSFGNGSNAQVLDFEEGRNLKQKSWFGELSYDVTDKVTATIGARFFRYEKEITKSRAGAIYGNISSFELVNNEEDGVSYKANVTYKPSEGVLLYSQWAQGFRLGGPLPDLPDVCDTNNDGLADGLGLPLIGVDRESDELDSYEIGTKLSFLDSRMQLNLAIFKNDWQGIPVTVGIPSCGFNTSINAGEAESHGVELEGNYRLSQNLLIDIGAAYIKAQLAKDQPNLGMDGDRLPGSPEYNANIGLQYEFDLAGNDAFLRGDYLYVGGFFNRIGEQGQEVGGYSQINLSAGVTIRDIDIDLFVKNATNSSDITWMNIFNSTSYRLRPRTVGLNVSYSF